MARIIPLVPAPRVPKPEWLKVRAPGSPSYTRLKGIMRELNLHTVCEEAQCPRSEEHTSELQSLRHLVCRLLLESSTEHRDLHSFPTRRSSDLRATPPI